MARSGRARGEAFEGQVVKALRARLPSLRNREWFSFTDANGASTCEPDAFVVRGEELLIFEIKLTACRYGHEQLAGLYAPVLGHVFGLPVRCLQIAKALHAGHPGPLVDSLDEFLSEGSLPLALLHLPDVRFL